MRNVSGLLLKYIEHSTGDLVAAAQYGVEVRIARQLDACGPPTPFLGPGAKQRRSAHKLEPVGVHRLEGPRGAVPSRVVGHVAADVRYPTPATVDEVLRGDTASFHVVTDHRDVARIAGWSVGVDDWNGQILAERRARIRLIPDHDESVDPT